MSPAAPSNDHEHDLECECCANGPEAFAARLEQIIADFGVAVIGTTATVAGRDVAMSYTVGLSDAGLPELFVFGLPAQAATVILTDASVMARAGKLPLDVEVAELGNLPLVFKSVAPALASDFIVKANSRAGKDLPGIQLFWPDPAGVFPWAPGFDSRYVGVQPLLYAADN